MRECFYSFSRKIMKYLARAIEQMRAVDGILILQFPWPNVLGSWP